MTSELCHLSPDTERGSEKRPGTRVCRPLSGGGTASERDPRQGISPHPEASQRGGDARCSQQN
jgi:hypothetical protein